MQPRTCIWLVSSTARCRRMLAKIFLVPEKNPHPDSLATLRVCAKRAHVNLAGEQ